LRFLGVASASESGPGADDICASIRVRLRGHELFVLLMSAAKSEGHVRRSDDARRAWCFGRPNGL